MTYRLFHNLGIAFKQLGQVDAAVESYQKALAVNPDYVEAHNNLGNAYKELGQLDDAVKSYEKALAINPDFTGAQNNLSDAKALK